MNFLSLPYRDNKIYALMLSAREWRLVIESLRGIAARSARRRAEGPAAANEHALLSFAVLLLCDTIEAAVFTAGHEAPERVFSLNLPALPDLDLPAILRAAQEDNATRLASKIDNLCVFCWADASKLALSPVP